eukprot:COSAG01_NODE_33439_length_564_cov_0.737634_1_plen_73_part_01
MPIYASDTAWEFRVLIDRDIIEFYVAGGRAVLTFARNAGGRGSHIAVAADADPDAWPGMQWLAGRPGSCQPAH